MLAHNAAMVVVFVKAFEAFVAGSTGSHLSVMRYVTHVKKSNRNRFTSLES